MIENKVGKKAVIMGTSGTQKDKVNLGAAVAMLGGVIGCGSVQVRYVLEYFRFRQKIWGNCNKQTVLARIWQVFNSVVYIAKKIKKNT